MFRLFLLAILTALPVHAEPLSADQIRADFQQLYETLQQNDPDLYAHLGREEYDSLYQVTLNSFTDPAERPELAKKFQRFVAAGGVSHARIDANYADFRDYVAQGGRIFPIYIKLVHGRYYIADNRSGVKGIRRGEEIFALNREPIRDVFARAAGNLSADNAYMAQTQLETDFPMALWLDLGAKTDHVELTFARKRVTFHKTIPFLTEPEMAQNAKREPPVLSLDGHRRTARVFGDVAYLRPGPFRNFRGGRDDHEFRDWLIEAFRGFSSRESKTLLIDLRDNPGGSEAFALDLMSWFATRPFRLHQADDPTDPRPAPRFEGKVFLLVNRNSFSACAVMAAAVQDQHFGLILGERSSDLATGDTAIRTFELDNSHLVVGYPTSKMVRVAGEDTPRFVLPDVLIDTPVIEGPEDPVLQQAFDLVTR